MCSQSLSVLKLMAAAGIKPDIPFATIPNQNPSEMSKETSPLPESPAQESPENILNPLAIYRMARTALHGKQTKSPSSCPTPENDASSSSKSIQRSETTPAVQNSDINLKNPLHISQQSHQWSFHDTGGISPLDQSHATTQRDGEYSSFTPNNSSSISQPVFGDIWDPTDSALMDMLDGGMTPWTADYLTDGQSGIDPFLFPF
ncbi:hypothetical protein N7528_009860 [Penicillium herquei]|nr:hypothetical protein N7528_009860 [Penicillium herquei]